MNPSRGSDRPRAPTDHRDLPDISSFAPGEGKFHLKGHVYRSTLQHLDDLVPGGAVAVLDRLGDERARAFFSQQFVAGAWYDVFPMVTLVVQVARMLGVPYFKAVSDLSRMMAVGDLNGVYRALLRMVSPDFLARRLPSIQAQYLDFGGITIGETRPRYCEAFRTGHPLVLVHWYVAVVHGFLPLVLTHAGAKDPRVRWDPPTSDGIVDGFELVTLRFEIQWA